MRKLIKRISILTVVLAMTISQLAYAKPIEVTAKDGTIHYVFVMAPNPTQEISMLQYSDMIGEAPGIEVFIDGERAGGKFSYPNYDNSRLGVWDLEWVFTPTDDNFDPITGSMRFNVRPREAEIPEEPTNPSLTATIVTLESRTAYDINLNNKVSGSKYRWTSSNPDVAKVNAKNGLVTAVSEGEALITCEITLPDGEVQELTSIVNVGYDENAPELTETILDLEVGDKFDINLENKIAKSKYRWVSSDRGIIRVNSSNGKVTAVGPGDAHVTCTITTPENQVIVLRCDVSVTASEVTE